MFKYVRIRRGRWLALVLCIMALATMVQAQVPLRGPPLSSRPPNQQIQFTDPNTGLMINTIVPKQVPLMPPMPALGALNNGSLGNYPIQGLPGAQNSFIFSFPPEQSGITGIGGGFGGGIGGIGGGIGGIGGGIGGIGGGIGGIGGGIGGIGGGIGGIGGGIGGIGGIGGGIGGIGGIGGGGLGGFGGGLGGFGGVLGSRTFPGSPGAGFSGFGGTFAGFGGAAGALGGGF